MRIWRRLRKSIFALTVPKETVAPTIPRHSRFFYRDHGRVEFPQHGAGVEELLAPAVVTSEFQCSFTGGMDTTRSEAFCSRCGSSKVPQKCC